MIIIINDYDQKVRDAISDAEKKYLTAICATINELNQF